MGPNIYAILYFSAQCAPDLSLNIWAARKAPAKGTIRTMGAAPRGGNNLKNLFEYWDHLLQPMDAKGRVLLFLDYDGTLAPIAPSPCEALLPEKNRELIRELAKVPSYMVA